MFRRKASVLLYLLPGLIGLTAFSLAPFIGGVYYSMTDGSFQNHFVWFENYAEIWRNEMFLLGLKNTMALSLFCAPAIWVLSFLIAVMLKSLGRRAVFFRNALLLPYLMPSAALLLIWLLAFDYGGIINRMLAGLGFSRVLWLEGSMLRVPVIAMYIWKNVGFSVVIFASALQSVPESVLRVRTAGRRGPAETGAEDYAAAAGPHGVSGVYPRMDQRLQDFQGGLLHRRRVSRRSGVYPAAFYEQQVSPDWITRT